MSANHARNAVDLSSDDGATAPGALSSRDLHLLAFERDWTGRAATKEAAIRSEFGLSAPRYYQLLHALLESPVALAFDPVLVRRLQRIRDSRAAARANRTFLRPGGTADAPTDQDSAR